MVCFQYCSAGNFRLWSFTYVGESCDKEIYLDVFHDISLFDPPGRRLRLLPGKPSVLHSLFIVSYFVLHVATVLLIRREWSMKLLRAYI